jgi:hypothetical protein
MLAFSGVMLGQQQKDPQRPRRRCRSAHGRRSPAAFRRIGKAVSDETKPPALPALSATEQPVREKYLKPAFRYEKVFETMALACGKISSTQGSCHSNRKIS